MHIDRKPSTVMMIIDRIYNPISQNFDISLLLRNKIKKEMEFPPKFFINLLQITGNLVANAVNSTSPNGSVDVVFTTEADGDDSTLSMTVIDTGKIIPPDQVSAFNQGKQVAKLMGGDVGDGFTTRLEYVMQLVSEESGQIIVKNGKDSGKTFSLSFPLQDHYINIKNGSHTIVKNSTVLLNGS